MATRRRDIIPSKEKRPMPSPGPRLTPKPPASTTPLHPKIAPDVSRQTHGSRTTSLSSSSTTPKTPSCIPHKTTTTTLQRPVHVSTHPSPRPSSTMPKKAVPSQKPAPDKENSGKAPVKEAAKQRPIASKPGPAGKRVISANAKKQGMTENSMAATKGNVNRATPVQKKVEHKKAAPIEKTPSQEFFLSENEELTFTAVAGDHEMGVDDAEPAGLETYSIDQFEAENFDEPDIVTAEPSMITEHEEAPISVEKEEPEDNTFVKEDSIKPQIESNEINNCNSAETAAYDTKSMEDEAAEEKKQELEIATTKQETVEEKKQNLEDAPAKQEMAEETKQALEAPTAKQETSEENKQDSEGTAPEQEPAAETKEESDNAVEEKKQELEGSAPKDIVKEKKQELDNAAAPKLTFQAEKPESAFVVPKLRSVQGIVGSNGVIEETVNKLSERKNKVRALAGAFETVIALQDHKR